MFEQELPKYLTQEETAAFFSKIHDRRDRALFDLIYKYGLRVKEATLVQLADVDLKRGKIFVKRVKGSVSGEKPLFSDSRRLLRAYLESRHGNSQVLFTGRQGRLQERRIQQLFKLYLAKARIKRPVGVHSLRHSIAIHLLDAGQSLEFVKDHLGHKYLKNTEVYARISDRRRSEVFDQLEISPAIVRN
jgi:site-specific recombinase XerD